MMLLGIERLAADPDTEVIVLVSKPPAERVARRVLEAAQAAGKPVVVNFLGGDPRSPREAGAIPAATLEDAARLAVAVARGRCRSGTGIDAIDDALLAAADARPSRAAPGQRDGARPLQRRHALLRRPGCILGSLLGDRRLLASIDLGDDEYTVGRPHPMIDFRLRNEHIVAAAEDPSTAVILLDIVLGYGSHADPAGRIRAGHRAGPPRRRRRPAGR